MHFIKRLTNTLSRAGWRRVVFACFCLLMVSIGAYYLYHTEDVDPRGSWEEEIAVFHVVVAWAMVGFGLLGIATPWLVSRGRLPVLAPSALVKAAPGERRWFWLGVTVCTIGAGLLWQTRMEKSIWTDEVTSMRRNIVGRWKHNDEGSGKFLRPTWADTLLDYHTPNNHVLYSVVARVLHEEAGGINKTDFSKPYFNVFILRLPSLIAGLFCVGLVGYLALKLHSLLAAWLAMCWLALHPWMFEFTTSARGYAFSMVFLALAAVAAVKIFRGGGGWRWWVTYGLGQMLAFCSVPTLLHGLVAMNLAVFVGICADRATDRSARWAHLRAFFAVNTMAAIGVYLAFKPKLAQLDAYLASDHFHSAMPWTWMADCATAMLAGQPYFGWEKNHPWASAADAWPVVLFVLAVLLALAFAIAALWRGWRGGLFTGLFALACLLPPLTAYLQGRAMSFYLFPWYTAWHLPLFLTLFASGAAELLTRTGKRLPRWATPVGAVGVVLLIAAATHHPRKAYYNIAVEPQRDSAAYFRDSPNPWAPGHDDIISISLTTANHSYDPWNVRMKELDDLWAQIRIAEETGKPLYCDTAWIESIPSEHPEFEPVLLDARYFERLQRFYGLQPQNSRYIFRYIPGSLREKALTMTP